MMIVAYPNFDKSNTHPLTLQHRYVLKLREAIGLCSAPPAAAHYLLEKVGKSLGMGRGLWPKVEEERGISIEERITYIVNQNI